MSMRMEHARVETHATIGGHRYTLFFDYDHHVLDTFRLLREDGKVEWLEKRMDMILLKPLRPLFDPNSPAYDIVNDYSRGEEGIHTITLLAVSLVLQGAEGFGSYLLPISDDKESGKNRRRFRAFMTSYMTEWFQQTPLPPACPLHVDLLWTRFRNPLAHSFRIEAPIGIEPLGDGSCIRKGQAGQPEISALRLFEHFEVAVRRFFEEARTLPAKKQAFLERFDATFKL